MSKTYTRNFGARGTCTTVIAAVGGEVTVSGTGLDYPLRHAADDPEGRAGEVCDEYEVGGWTLQGGDAA